LSNRVTHQCRHDDRSRDGDRQVEGVRTGGGHAFFCRQKAGAQLSAIGPAVELPLIVGDAVGELDDLGRALGRPPACRGISLYGCRPSALRNDARPP
jgi:hypothetical protein